MKIKKPLMAALLVLLTAAFLFSGFMALKTIRASRMERKGFRELVKQVSPRPRTEQNSQPDAQEPPEEIPEETMSPYASLKEQNPDLFGWLSIDGTVIDYPVMFTPEDEEYYLRRDFNGQYSNSGVPFLSGEWFRGCGNYLIYGHKMKNGTMFASLLSYDQESYWREHPVIHFDTMEGLGDYEVVAAFYSRIYERDEEGVFRYYRYVDLSDRSDFGEYVEQIKAASVYDTGITPVYGDTLLTLSTCSYHTALGRFVVVARKM